MQVVARQKGFYGTLREVGDAFSVADDQAFSAKWMVKADTPEGKALYEAHNTKQVMRAGRPSLDQLTGERLEAGGAPEIILDLTRQVKALKVENEELKERIVAARALAKEPEDRSDTADAVATTGPDKGQDADFKSGSGRQRRRRASAED